MTYRDLNDDPVRYPDPAADEPEDPEAIDDARMAWEDDEYDRMVEDALTG